jgi:hypothetical protein
VPCEAAEELGILGHAAHVDLKEGEAILDRCELLKELLLSELLFREIAFVLVASVNKTFHDHAPVLSSVCWESTPQNAIVALDHVPPSCLSRL